MKSLIACSRSFALLGLFFAAPAVAGTLDLDTTAYIDPSSFQWRGTSGFNNGVGLAGTVDWAVYGPNTFPVGFVGYTPTANEFVYVYQVHETGPLSLSSFSVNIDNPADAIGTFTGNTVSGSVSGDPATLQVLNALDSATWKFSGVLQNGSSVGLVYSSPNAPTFSFGTTIDHGTSAAVGTFANPTLPSPSSVQAPEPASFVMAAFTLASAGLGALALKPLRRALRRQ